MIRPANDNDFETIFHIINDGATAYKGVIPEDRYHEPYMSKEELSVQLEEKVVFYCYEEDGEVTGVMGIQDVQDVTLIRHAYVKTDRRGRGTGKKLLAYLISTTQKPVLIGTWKDAVWAIGFYQKQGFTLTGEQEKEYLLRKYWNIPERQVETSVVLTDNRWREKK